MKITMSFEGDVQGSVSLDVEAPGRMTFAKMATALWHSYKALRAQKLAPLPTEIVITAIRATGLVEVMRAIRTNTGLGLVDAKKVMDAVTAGRSQPIYVTNPEGRSDTVKALLQAGASVQGYPDHA